MSLFPLPDFDIEDDVLRCSRRSAFDLEEAEEEALFERLRVGSSMMSYSSDKTRFNSPPDRYSGTKQCSESALEVCAELRHCLEQQPSQATAVSATQSFRTEFLLLMLLLL
mmetsp:Transcript_7490/g.14823  ORF Transcript_7490/g.14823 Transcript_7490/m.14823 type:complete len:111 (+) Transcript_7490:255-587(+)